MKNTFKVVSIALVAVFTLSAATCFGQSSGGGGRVLNSVEDLKKYLDSQPANGPDKPIRVTMNANAPMLKKIEEAIEAAGKYVSLTISGNALTTIPSGAFSGWSNLVSITLPNSITTIPDGVFTRSGLISVTIPNSITRIGNYAFMECKSLTSVTIPNSVTSIGERAFANSGLTGITIPNSVTSIESDTFSSCDSLTSITIPDTVTSIGGGAFWRCTSLTSVTFQGTIAASNLSSYAFGSNEPEFAGYIEAYIGDLRAKYLAGGIGTYTRTSGSLTWTKQ